MSLDIPTLPIKNTSEKRNIQSISNPAMHAVLSGSALIGILIYFLKVSKTVPISNWTLTIFYSVVFIGFLFTAFLRPISVRIRFVIFLALLFLVGTIDLFIGGLNSDGVLFLLVFTVLSAVFYGIRTGLIIAVMPLIVFIFISFGMTTRLFSPNPALGVLQSNSFFDWAMIGMVLLFGIVASYTGIHQMIPRLIETLFITR
jgi:hypothetical protein